MAIQKTLIREIKLKDGVTTYPVGTQASITFTPEGKAVIDLGGQKPIKASPSLLSKYFSGFSKVPTVATLQRWDDKGGCKTITGAWVEPDGVGPDGAPSWLRALGMI